MSVQTEMFAEAVKRPRSDAGPIVEAAAREYAKEMHASYAEWSIDEWAEALAKEYRSHDDGYEFAKKLERHGHAPDAEMVRMLDDFDFRVREHWRRAVESWVEAVGFEPLHSVGDLVDLGKHYKDGERRGRITEIRHKTAEYLVNVDPASKSAYIVAAESVAAA